MAARPSISLFYDCLSPFSYLAFSVLRRYRPIWNIDLVLRPTMLGGVMMGSKNLPPGARPWAASTTKWAGQDMERNKAYFNVPLLPGPSNFFGPDGPADPRGLARDLRYMRLLTSLRLTHPEALEEATAATFAAIWSDPDNRDADGAAVMTEQTLLGICAAGGLDEAAAAAAVASVGDKKVKGALKASVAEALDLGMFGAPFMVVDRPAADGSGDMVYFGSDRFEQMAFSLDLPWMGPDPARPSSSSPSKL